MAVDHALTRELLSKQAESTCVSRLKVCRYTAWREFNFKTQVKQKFGFFVYYYIKSDGVINIINPNYEMLKNYVIGKKIGIVGIGVSNLPILNLFYKSGAILTAYDKRSKDKIDEKTFDDITKKCKNIFLGDDYLDHLTGQDMLVISPGIRPDLPQIESEREKGVVITSEVKLFFDACNCKIIGITGSDGKTTTTTLIYEMLKAGGVSTFIGGNIGTPLISLLENAYADDVIVAELSSFQLFDLDKSPDIAVITNITPNHLDWHKSMEEYIDSKKNIFVHQLENNKLIVNAENEITNSFDEISKGEVIKFSYNNKTNGAHLVGDKIYYNDTFIMDKSDIILPGEHNVENYLTAISAVYGIVDEFAIRKVAMNFKGVAHRLEFVREVDGVKYYNDSIASTPTRTTAGLKSYNQKVILIAGGYDKKIPFDGFGEVIKEHVKSIVLVGATSQKLKREIESAYSEYEKQMPIVMANDFEFAVKSAAAIAREGDIVLLSPACASFDLFKNFEQRGNKFKEIVNSL